MKKIGKTSLACAAALLLAACSADDAAAPLREGEVGCPVLKIAAAEMAFSAETRAAQPMSPDIEKYVRTIAVFEFDNEGLHENRSTTYHFIDFVRGTVDGRTGVGQVDATEFGIVETTLEGLAFESRTDGTLCLVANVTEEQVSDFYENYREPGQSNGRITLDKFKEWALPFEYKIPKAGIYDETESGHLETMYMFGYYQGKIDVDNPEAISVDLGRLASRLDITIENSTGREITKRLGYHFDNVCRSAYFFPIKMSMPPAVGVGLSRTVICSGVGDPVEGDILKAVPETFADKASHTHYFYVAAHSAAGYEEATKLHLFYDSRIVDDTAVADESKSVKIPLCNVHPSSAAEVPNGYSLSRNTRYHFTIRLKGANSKTASVRSDASRPGEITVYLPLDE